jgi:NitT/TauT family transport system permease protein
VKQFLAKAAFFVGVFLVWEFGVRASGLPVWLLPAPSDVLAAARPALNQLAYGSLVTLYEAVIGFVAGAIAGALIAIAIAHAPYMRSTVMPAIIAFEGFPKVAIAPLIIVWFGIGMEAKIVMAILIVFFPVMVNTIAGLQNVSNEYIELAKVNSATAWQIFSEIRWPNALPYVFEGLRIALPLSLIGVIIAEFVASKAGLGFLIVSSSAQLNTPLVFAALAMLAVITLLLYACLILVERRVMSWHKPAVS